MIYSNNESTNINSVGYLPTCNHLSTSLENFSCDMVTWAECNQDELLRQLIEFPLTETLISGKADQKTVDSGVKRFLKNYMPYKENLILYHYKTSTPICYVRYKDITFLIAKPDGVMTRYTEDEEHGVILFTDGELFGELLNTYIFSCEKRNKKYIRPKLCPTKNQWKISFGHYVLMKTKGLTVYGKNELHHMEHMRNNMSDCIGILGKSEHIIYHLKERMKGHFFDSDDYMEWVRIHWGLTESEIKTFEQNLKLLIEILPYFKGIDISNNLDLTNDIRYLSNKDIWNNIKPY